MTIPANPYLSPELNVLVFYVINNETILDVLKMNIEKCTKNTAAIILSNTSVETGSNVKIKINSNAGSFCSLSAIDKSVTFMGKRNSIDLENVWNEFINFCFYTFN